MKTFKPAHFISRELSWLEFNQRVLDEAINPRTPLLERVKFLAIVSSNLDEFFEVRVAGIKQQIESGVTAKSVDGLTPVQTFRAIARRVRLMAGDQYACWRDELRPKLARKGFRFLSFAELSPSDLAWVDEYYRSQVRPVLTPLAIDPAHPFPQLLNKSLNMIVRLEASFTGQTLRHLAVVQVPRVLPRLILLPHKGHRDYLFLDQLIGHYLPDLYPGTKILGGWPFRVTRNSELYIDEEEIANLLKAVENELQNRRKNDVVRLEIAHDCPADIQKVLRNTFRLQDEDVYPLDGPINPTRLMILCEGTHSPELRDPAFAAPESPVVRGREDLFDVLRQRDVLVHHPYESFNTVVRLLQEAAEDERVLAIKQTLYRTGGDTRIIGALMNAVKKGKQVTAVVELRARFDEANNIQWARALEEAGVHVVYGLVGYKIHCKLSLVVRRDDDGIRRYVHLGTGNYNPNTAKLYTDLGLLTCRPEIGEDVTNLFNLLTGICQFRKLSKLLAAPFDLHERLLGLIEREIVHARNGEPARVVAKMNSLVEPQIIETLYRASQAGVKVDLVVRGICCLRPGVRGVSENITVRSIVDRFLEHSRIFYFENSRQPEVYISSADWMPRNFFRRVEVAFPIEDGVLRNRVIEEIIKGTLADNVKARFLHADGVYRLERPGRGRKPRRAQSEFMALSLKTLPAPPTTATGYPEVQLAPRPKVL